MKRRRQRSDQQALPGFLERLLIGPLQSITDWVCSPRTGNTAPPARAISLGHATQLYDARRREEVYLPLKLLNRHLYLLGQSGSGKTMFLFLILTALIQMGCGFAVIDIHGDLTRMILAYIASTIQTPAQLEMVKRKLMLFEAFDPVWAPGFDPLRAINPQRAYAEAFDMLGIFKSVWKDVAWGARMEELLRNLLLSLALSRRSLAEAPLFLINEQFRNGIVATLPDPDLRFYWDERFGTLSDRMRPMYIDPVLNKISVYTSDPYIRHMIAQRSSMLDFRHIMDSGRWLLVNVSKGVVGQNAQMTGGLIVSKFKSAAWSRSDIPESQRVDFTLAADEVQNFIGSNMGFNFEDILAEARKQKLGLILAHQNLAQLDRTLREAIFGNVGTMCFFKLGHNDIREVSEEFRDADQFLVKQTLLALGVAEMIKREPDGGFRKVSIHRLKTASGHENMINHLRDWSHQTYYRRRTDVDRELIRSGYGHNDQGVIISAPTGVDNRRRENLDGRRFGEGRL